MADEPIVCNVNYYSSNNRRTVRDTTIGSLILSPERISQESMDVAYRRLKEIAWTRYSNNLREITGIEVYRLNNRDKFKDVSITVEFNRETPTMIQIGSISALILGEISSLIGL